jgi:hypothetical protein
MRREVEIYATSLAKKITCIECIEKMEIFSGDTAAEV